jgi:hypothetical protein
MNARSRTTFAPVFILTRSRSGKPANQKDTKNADRSGEVYENKGQYDKVPEKNSDFVSEIAEFAQNFAGFAPNSASFAPPKPFSRRPCAGLRRNKLAATL